MATVVSKIFASSPNIVAPSVVAVVPVITALAAYGANNCVGGSTTLSKVFRSLGAGAVLGDIVVTDAGNQKAQLSFLFFGAALTGTYADKTAVAFAPDIANLVARVDVAATDYATFGSDSMAIAHVTNINKILSSATQDLQLVVTTTGTPTWLTVTDLKWHLHFSNAF